MPSATLFLTSHSSLLQTRLSSYLYGIKKGSRRCVVPSSHCVLSRAAALFLLAHHRTTDTAPAQQSGRKPSAAGHSGPHIDAGATSNQAPAHPHTDDHRPRPQRRSPRTAARPRGRQTPASRTQTRIRPESAQNRQKRHFPRRRRSPNATGGVLSDFSRGSGTWKTLRFAAQDRPRPASEGEESDTAARSKRQRRRMPAQDQSRVRQTRSHQKQIHAGIIAQPAAQQRPHHAAATRRVRRAALPVLCAARHLAAEERTSRRANAATRSRSISGAPRQKKPEAPHTRQRPPPLAVKCAELPQLPQRSTGRRNPTPQHPRSAANRIARRRRASPPDQSRKFSRWGRPGFRRPAPPGRQAHVYAPHNRSPRPTTKARRTCQGLLHYRTGGKRPPPAASGSNAFRRPASRRPPGPRVRAAPAATATRAKSV